jgi:hypothetical protein
MPVTLCPACGLPTGSESIGVGTVRPFDDADHSRGWTLQDADSAYLMIGDYGCIAPTRAEAIAEGRARAARGDL